MMVRRYKTSNILCFTLAFLFSFLIFSKNAFAYSYIYGINMEMTSESEATISWDLYNTSNMDCFVIERFKPSDGKPYESNEKSYDASAVPGEKMQLVSIVTDLDKRSATVPVVQGEKWVYTVTAGRLHDDNVTYYYSGSVDPYQVKDKTSGKKYDVLTGSRSSGYLLIPTHFAIPIKSVSAANGKVKVTWEKAKDATAYRIYTASSENGDYTLKKEAKKEETSCEITLAFPLLLEKMTCLVLE